MPLGRINEMKLSIIIPAYNSRKRLHTLIGKLQVLSLPGITKEIIVVDDYSPDRSFEVVPKRKDIILLRHKKNTGKGGAVATGLAKATGDILYIQDDDMEYLPKDIGRIIAPIVKGRADVCFGSRHMNHTNQYSSLAYYLGGVGIDMIINFYLKSKISDALTGAKAFNRFAYTRMKPIESKGFEIETEIAAKAVSRGLRIEEVPIAYNPRTHKEGKNIRWHHAIGILMALHRFTRPYRKA
jgi:glycosyltransferase involved in cell wall biosynthesis